MAPISPERVGLPGARAVMVLDRHWSDKSQPAATGRSHRRHFITSLAPGDGRRVAEAARGHWSVENRNHYRRDTCPWREDDHRHRRLSTAQNLALTRNALLAIIPFDDHARLAHCLDHYHRHPAEALKLILNAKPLP